MRAKYKKLEKEAIKERVRGRERRNGQCYRKRIKGNVKDSKIKKQTSKQVNKKEQRIKETEREFNKS